MCFAQRAKRITEILTLSKCWISPGLGYLIAMAFLRKALMASAFFIQSRASRPTLRGEDRSTNEGQIQPVLAAPDVTDIRTTFPTISFNTLNHLDINKL